MTAKTQPETQASDEISDAALDRISGGADQYAERGRLSERERPMSEDYNRTRQPQRPPMPPAGTGMNQPPRR